MRALICSLKQDVCNEQIESDDILMKRELVQPFVKWVGGKRQLLSDIKMNMPKLNKSNTYYEPFVGGGAVFLKLQHNKAVINDYNDELINTYKVIKNNVEDLIEDLKTHDNVPSYFYDIREKDRSLEFVAWSNVKRASRFIYLNKTCYNGMYRVNQQGFFNTPFGRYKNPNIVNEHVLREVSLYLNENDILIKTGDFYDAVVDAKRNDFVYFDPPYQPLSTTSNFTGYTAGGFDESQQIRLKMLCDDLNNKNVKFMVSNSNVAFIRELYDEYDIKVVNARRAINSNGQKRGNVEEVLITNY